MEMTIKNLGQLSTVRSRGTIWYFSGITTGLVFVNWIHCIEIWLVDFMWQVRCNMDFPAIGALERRTEFQTVDQLFALKWCDNQLMITIHKSLQISNINFDRTISVRQLAQSYY